MAQTKVAVWGFITAGVLSVVAAVIPMLRGGRLNVTFFALSVVWFVLGAAVAKKNRSNSAPPTA